MLGTLLLLDNMILRFFLITSSLALLISADRDESENRLHWHLFKSNQSALIQTRPAASAFHTTDVYIMLVLNKFIEMQEKDEVFIARYFLILEWEDKRLAWNASDFEDIDSIHVKTDMIWVPDIVLINDAKQEEDDIVPQSAYVQVFSDGKCSWLPSFRWSVSHCSMDSTWFPFDEQYCDLIYESWRYPAFKVNLTSYVDDDSKYKRCQLYSDFQPNDQWELMDNKTSVTVVSGMARVLFTFHMRRRPLYYIVNLIIPCCLLSFIAVVTFVLPASCSERLGLNITVLLALSFYQILVSDHLPASSESVPVVVMYFLFVMALCVMSLATTICVMYLENKCTDKVPVPEIPYWVKWLICMKLASCLRMKPSLKPATPSPVGSRKNSVDAVDMTLGTTDKLLVEIRNLLRAQFRKESEDRDVADEDEDKKNEWKLAAAVIDRILFITFSTLFVGGTLIFSITFTVVFVSTINIHE